jgi:predicted dehydrogenase
MGRVSGRPNRDGPLRAGIVGAGFVGAVHATAARRAGARIVGVSASTEVSTKEAVDRLEAEHGYPEADALVNAPDVDVVHICTPNHLHFALAEAALAAGKHVICEKPLTIAHADALTLCERADAEGAVATVPFVYRFYPMVREARARIARQPGTVRLVHGSYLQDWLSTDEDYNWRVEAEWSGPSRAFADIGSHWCDLVEFVTGDRIEAVQAELVTALPTRLAHRVQTRAFEPGREGDRASRVVTTEDAALVLFRTVAGVIGSVVVSQISSGHKNQLRFEISTADTTLAFDQEEPDSLWLGRRTTTEIVTRDVSQLDPSAAAYITLPPGHPQGYADCFAAYVADTYSAIRAGSANRVDGLPSFTDGARGVQITEAVLRSAESHRWEDVAAMHLAEGGAM